MWSMADSANKNTDELLPEYNLKELLQGGILGKYAESFHAGPISVTVVPTAMEQREIATLDPERS